MVSHLRIAPIVEGHGDVEAVPELLRRIWSEVIHGDYVDVLKPIRQPRSKLLRRNPNSGRCEPDDDSISRAVRLAAAKLATRRDEAEAMPELILMLLDADSDCAAHVGPAILKVMCQVASCLRAVVVLPVVEFESWFVAAAESLHDYLDVPPTDIAPEPETSRSGKAWIEERFRGRKYSETVDQVRMTARINLNLCRQRSRSFEKLCRDLERLS